VIALIASAVLDRPTRRLQTSIVGRSQTIIVTTSRTVAPAVLGALTILVLLTAGGCSCGVALVDADDADADASADADRDADADVGTDADVWEPDYRGRCPARYFYSACSGGADCATSDRAAHWLELWWQAMLDRLTDPDEVVRGRIEVVEAWVSEAVDVNFSVDFVIHVGWVRARGRTTLNLGRAPLAADPDDATMLGLLRAAIPCDHLPTGVVSYDVVESLVESCDPGLDFEICGFSWRDPPECGIGLWLMRNMESGLCRYASFDLERGVPEFCTEMDCALVP
jgi:hypothetical protein